jgi:hypothetical protein
MTDRPFGGEQERAPASAGAPLRVAVIDTDSGFLQVLTKRLERLSWEHRVLSTPVPVETIVAMRVGAVVVDLASLGPHGWDYLEKLCEAPARASAWSSARGRARSPSACAGCGSARTTG